jgi:hypothetical protein
MAYTGTIVTEAEMQFFAGENVDSDGDTEANHQYLADYAEAYLSSLVKYDIVTNWDDLNSTYKKLFTEWAARNAAIALITYNIRSYPTRTEAEDMINVHIYHMEKIEEMLKTPSIKDFLEV